MGYCVHHVRRNNTNQFQKKCSTSKEDVSEFRLK